MSGQGGSRKGRPRKIEFKVDDRCIEPTEKLRAQGRLGSGPSGRQRKRNISQVMCTHAWHSVVAAMSQHGMDFHTDEPMTGEEIAVQWVHQVAEQRDALLAACEATLARLDYLQDLWGKEAITSTLAEQVRAAVAKATKGGPA